MKKDKFDEVIISILKKGNPHPVILITYVDEFVQGSESFRIGRYGGHNSDIVRIDTSVKWDDAPIKIESIVSVEHIKNEDALVALLVKTFDGVRKMQIASKNSFGIFDNFTE